MMKRLIYILVLIVAIGLPSIAQRRITPVNPNLSRPESKVEKTEDGKEKPDMSRYIEARDAQGNTFLIDSVTGEEYVDSAALKEKDVIKYPKFHEVTIGLNVWDPVMRLLGQKYGGVEVWGELSIHNRFKPVFELGVGTADYTPDEGNYTFKTSTVPYFRIGMNYNFLYKKITDYQFYVGLRYGMSPFKYEVNNVSVDGGYWNEPETFNIPSQKTTVGYMEFVAGLKVKIWNNFYMGWAMKYHSILHESKAKYGKPMYIPGYGTRGSSITGAFSLMYVLPIEKKKPEIVNVDAVAGDQIETEEMPSTTK